MPAAAVAATPPESPVRSGPVEFDEVILAWNATLAGLNEMTKSMVSERSPSALDGDIVTFGVPNAQFLRCEPVQEQRRRDP